MLDIVWLLLIFYLFVLGIYYLFKLKFKNLRILKLLKSINKNTLDNLFLSMGTKIGVGSIIGTVIAINIGGSGTLIWIWIFTLLTSSLIYIESKLGYKYKKRLKDGYVGGPNFYIKEGLNKKKLAILYLIVLIISYSFFFLMIQTNTISELIKINFNVNISILLLIFSILLILLIFSSLKEIINILNKLVPFMCIFLIIIGLYVIIKNYKIIPSITLKIFENAFNFKCFVSGLIPLILISIKRNIFQNELLYGTASISSSIKKGNIESIANTQILSSYFISFIICTLVTFLVLIYNEFNIINTTDYNLLISNVFIFHFNNIGPFIIVILLTLFALTTIISGYYFGLSNLLYLTKNKLIIFIFKLFVLLFTLSGLVLSNDLIWRFVDTMMLILISINTYAVTKLGSEVIDK